MGRKGLIQVLVGGLEGVDQRTEASDLSVGPCRFFSAVFNRRTLFYGDATPTPTV